MDYLGVLSKKVKNPNKDELVEVFGSESKTSTVFDEISSEFIWLITADYNSFKMFNSNTVHGQSLSRTKSTYTDLSDGKDGYLVEELPQGEENKSIFNKFIELYDKILEENKQKEESGVKDFTYKVSFIKSFIKKLFYFFYSILIISLTILTTFLHNFDTSQKDFFHNLKYFFF